MGISLLDHERRLNNMDAKIPDIINRITKVENMPKGCDIVTLPDRYPYNFTIDAKYAKSDMIVMSGGVYVDYNHGGTGYGWCASGIIKNGTSGTMSVVCNFRYGGSRPIGNMSVSKHGTSISFGDTSTKPSGPIKVILF